MSLWELPHAAAKADPASSHAASREVTESGQREKNMHKVAALIQSMPGRTTLELSVTQQAKDAGLTRHEIARRAIDCERAGLIWRGALRKCRQGNRLAQEWHPREQGGVSNAETDR
jgi:hypothetical protein